MQEFSRLVAVDRQGDYCLVMQQDPTRQSYIDLGFPTTGIAKHETPYDAAIRAAKHSGLEVYIRSGRPFIVDQDNRRFHYMWAEILGVTNDGYPKKILDVDGMKSEEDLAEYVIPVLKEMQFIGDLDAS